MSMGKPGGTESAPAPRKRTAYELRHRYAWLNQFSDDELRDISFCDENTPLEDGAQYFDISRPERGQIIGRGGQMSPPGSCYVWRDSVSGHTWNKLLSYGSGREAGR